MPAKAEESLIKVSTSSAVERSNLEFQKGTNETHNVTRKQVKFYKRIQKILLKTHKPQCKSRFISKIPKP